jgi:hypothetical protein
MLAAGNQNPDVRMTGGSAPKSGATVKVDAQIDNEEDVLRDMRAIRLGPFVPPKQKHPSRTRQAQPRSLRPANTKSSLARPPAIPAPRSRLSLPARHPSSPPQPSAEVVSWLPFTRFITCNHAGNSYSEEGGWRVEMS